MYGRIDRKKKMITEKRRKGDAPMISTKGSYAMRVMLDLAM